MPGSSWTVLPAWQPFMDMPLRSPAGYGVLSEVDNAKPIDETTKAARRRNTDDGIKLAPEAGSEAVDCSAAHSAGAADALLDEARTLDATAIALGSREPPGIKSILLGSLSHGVPHHADRPVREVPSDAVVASPDAHHHATDRAGAEANQR
jgi:nucleotide-binding universal stress UspA family protein